MSYSFAKIFTRLNSFTRLGSCTNSSNPTRSLSLLCASNKLQKNVINGISNIGLVSVNKGYYVGPDVERIHRLILGKDYFKVEAPNYWPSVPIVPIRSTSLLPVYHTDFKITDKGLMEVIKRKMAENEPYIGMFLVKDENNESKLIKNADDIYPIGTFTRIYKLYEIKDYLGIAVVGDRRISFSNLRNFEKEGDEGSHNNGETFFADIHNVTHEKFHYTDEMKKLVDEILKTIKDISVVHKKHGHSVLSDLNVQKAFYENPVNLSDFSATLASDSAKPKELQLVLEETNIHKRLELCLNLLKNDLKWRSKIPETSNTSFMCHMPINY